MHLSLAAEPRTSLPRARRCTLASSAGCLLVILLATFGTSHTNRLAAASLEPASNAQRASQVDPSEGGQQQGQSAAEADAGATQSDSEAGLETGPVEPSSMASSEASEPRSVSGDASSLDNLSSWRPIFAMAVGVVVVLTLMIGLKTHAFIALVLGALAISLFIPLDVTGFVKSPEPHVIRADQGAPVNIVTRVTSTLGGAVGGIGILIAMAAIIGKCMLVSGAADRIVKSALTAFGERRAALAMMVSGFILSVPVFFDTVFYLLVPLARSLYRTTGRNYLLYLGAIAAGGAITHTLVPPTPGPLLVVEALQADIGVVMMIGVVVGFPAALIGLLAASWLNRVMPIEMRPMVGASGMSTTPDSERADDAIEATEEPPLERLPSLPLALVPVLLPVLLITIKTVYTTFAGAHDPTGEYGVQGWLELIGSPDLAMVLAALFAIYLCRRIQGYSLRQLAEIVEDALLSGGVIILITAAGGAFGGLLAMTEIHVLVQSFFAERDTSGLWILGVAYALAAILKVAQGSSTVSMIIASSLVAPLATRGELGFNPGYLVPAIGAGSLLGSWMNDSGFWVFAKMGVLTEGETLRSWTVLLCILSVSSFLITLVMASLIPWAS